jgi:hypothetical protein
MVTLKQQQLRQRNNIDSLIAYTSLILYAYQIFPQIFNSMSYCTYIRFFALLIHNYVPHVRAVRDINSYIIQTFAAEE